MVKLMESRTLLNAVIGITLACMLLITTPFTAIVSNIENLDLNHKVK